MALTDLDFARGRPPFLDVEERFAAVGIPEVRLCECSYSMSDLCLQPGIMGCKLTTSEDVGVPLPHLPGHLPFSAEAVVRDDDHSQ